MAKSQFGVISPNLTRTYAGDVPLAAGVAVIAGAAPASVTLPAAPNARALGVTALPTINAGDPVPLIQFGEVTAIADGPIARNQWVIINSATGQLAPVGNVSGTFYEVVGIALEAAVQQGDEFLLFVIPFRTIDNAASPIVSSLTLNGFFFESFADNLVAHAGGGQANATPLTAEINRIGTVVNVGDSCVLPPAQRGLTIMVINHGANPAQIFGTGNDVINDVPAGIGVSQMQGSFVIYSCVSAGQWYANGIGTGYAGSLPTVSSLNGTVAFAGGGQANATLLPAVLNRVTVVASVGDSVKLVAASVGVQQTVTNAAANSMNLFPGVNDAINSLGVNAAFAIPGGKTANFSCAVAGQWHSVLSA